MSKIKIFFIIILMLASLGQIASDIYLPSLPIIAKSLSSDVRWVQFTISLYMYGFAFSQLIYGPLSDGIGRKKPLLVGLIILLMGSIICFYAPSISWLLLGRFLQGLGAGSGIALSRAVMRDVYEGTNLARVGSYLAAATIVFMTCAPLLGGYIQHFLGWRFNFAFLILYALILLAAIAALLPETNKHMHVDHLKPEQIIKNLKALFINPAFIVFSIVICATYAGILAWLTVGPVLLQSRAGLTPVLFGWFVFTSGCSYFIGAMSSGKLVKKLGINQLLIVGTSCMFASGILMLLGKLIGLYSLVIIIPVIIFTMGTSMTMANAYAGALQPFPKIAGIAGSILGFMQILGGAISSSILSYCHNLTQLPLAIAFTVTSGIALIAVVWLKSR